MRGDAGGTIGVVQMRSVGDVDVNLRACAAAVRVAGRSDAYPALTAPRQCGSAAKRGVQLLCFPECFAFLGGSSDETVRVARTRSRDVLAFMQACARRHRLWLSLGGLHVRVPAPLRHSTGAS